MATPIDHAWAVLKYIPTRPRGFELKHPRDRPEARRIPTPPLRQRPGGRPRPAVDEARDARIRESHPHFPLRRHEEFSDALDEANLQHHAANAAWKLAGEKGLIDPNQSNDNFWSAMLDRYSDYDAEPYIERLQSIGPRLSRDERELEELGYLTHADIPARTLPPREGSDMYNLENPQ